MFDRISRSVPAAVSAMTGLALLTASGAGMAQDKPDEITVAYFLEWPTANMVAKAEDRYSEELGVEVKWQSFADGNDMSSAMASDDVQIAYSQGLVPYMVAVTRGLPLQMVGVAVSYAENDQCVVHEDTGITKENAEELEGERIASPIGNVTHYKLLRTLDHLGVDADAVNIVSMDGNSAAAALSRGDVAMACAFGGPLVEMRKHGDYLMTTEEQEEIGIRVFDVVSATESFAEEHPDLVAEFMRVTDEINREYMENPDDMYETIADQSGMDLEASNDMLSKFSFPTTEEQISEEWLGGTVQQFTKEVADFFVEQGELNSALDDYSPYITTRFLEQSME